MWMGCQNKKGIGIVPDPFSAGAYTISNKRPAPNSGLAMRDYTLGIDISKIRK